MIKSSRFVLLNITVNCIFDKNSPIDHLEQLDSHGVKFVKVDSVKTMLNVVKKQDVERIASRGKRLNQVI